MKKAFTNAGVLEVFVASLEEPLSHVTDRTPDDNLIIELVLTLFRNLLAISNVRDNALGYVLVTMITKWCRACTTMVRNGLSYMAMMSGRLVGEMRPISCMRSLSCTLSANMSWISSCS